MRAEPFPNKKGHFISCVNPECEMWGHRFDLEGWNRRQRIPDISDYLFRVEKVFKSGNFYETQELVCLGCGRKGATKHAVKHATKCKIKKFLNASR